MIGSASKSWDATSGGVNTAATAKAMTIRNFLNFFNFSKLVMRIALRINTMTGTSKVIPNAINIWRTKLMYESISGAKEIDSGENFEINWNRKSKTT